MAGSLMSKIAHGWNVFKKSREPTNYGGYGAYGGTSYRPDRTYISFTSEKSVVSSMYSRLALDVASVDIEHVRLDEEQNYTETIMSGLNRVLTESANIDQTGRALIMDIALSMFDEGCVAVVPVETTLDPYMTGGYGITNMRVGKITQFYPKHVRVRLYNERTGNHEEITMLKELCAVIENPLFEVMNQPNSTLSRLIRKINLLDMVDEASGSGKLDIIIQLPYQVRNEKLQERAEESRNNIEMQLKGSKYGIAYADSNAKIHQLNRPAENNLMGQIEYLTSMLYSQLGLTDSVFNGKATEEEMTNYYKRTIEPIIAAICDEFKRKFLTQTARTQGQSIRYFIDPFKFIPASELSELMDSTSRNAIMAANEWRSILGRKPSADPIASKLSNKNINQDEGGGTSNVTKITKNLKKLKKGA